MKFLRFNLPFIALLSFALFIGCQTTLAPAYDQAIVDGVTQNSELALRFFASLEGGTEATDFATREDTYNVLIGAFESLKIQAHSRPVPKNIAIDKINELLQAKGSSIISGDYPSAFAFGQIADTFKKMKQTDSQNGLKPLALKAFKGQVEIFLDQAITYESFLKR